MTTADPIEHNVSSCDLIAEVSGRAPRMGANVGLFGYAALAVLAVTFLDLGLMPGAPGINRFGFNPAAARRTRAGS